MQKTIFMGNSYKEQYENEATKEIISDMNKERNLKIFQELEDHKKEKDTIIDIYQK
jgi:hypothetical protein